MTKPLVLIEQGIRLEEAAASGSARAKWELQTFNEEFAQANGIERRPKPEGYIEPEGDWFLFDGEDGVLKASEIPPDLLEQAIVEGRLPVQFDEWEGCRIVRHEHWFEFERSALALGADRARAVRVEVVR